MRRIALEAGLLILLSILIGIGSAGLRRPSIPMRLPDEFFVPESGARLLLLAHAGASLEEGGVLFVDARPEVDFVRGHIPGAISIPSDRYPDLAAAVSEWIEGVPIIIYGSTGNINEADNLAGQLMEYGYGPISILVDGFEVWAEAGLSVDAGRNGLLDSDPWEDDDDFWDGESDPWESEDGDPDAEGYEEYGNDAERNGANLWCDDGVAPHNRSQRS